MKKIILNHKSYLKYDEIVDFINKFDKLNKDGYEFILFPSIIYLSLFKNKDYLIGTQNFYSSKEGSFSGEINLESLKNMGITYTMIGQYDRIDLLGESITEIKEKLFKSLKAKFNTILCLGEFRNNKNPFSIIKHELNIYLKSIEKNNIKYLSILYEPRYITNNIDCHQLKKLVYRIKTYIKNKYSINIEVYYGGIIQDDKVNQLLEIFDGIMLNKKSIDINEIKKIMKKI